MRSGWVGRKNFYLYTQSLQKPGCNKNSWKIFRKKKKNRSSHDPLQLEAFGVVGGRRLCLGYVTWQHQALLVCTARLCALTQLFMITKPVSFDLRSAKVTHITKPWPAV